MPICSIPLFDLFSVDTFLENKDNLPLEEQLRILLEKMDMASLSSKTIPNHLVFPFKKKIICFRYLTLARIFL